MDGLDVPYIFCVFTDRAVTRELSRRRNIVDTHSQPVTTILNQKNKSFILAEFILTLSLA